MKQNFNEIKQNWNFYMCRVDDKPASIRLNLALSNIAPVEDYKHRISIFIKMNNPTDDGLSSNEEYPMLCDIEDEVIDRLETLENIFAGTVKTQGRLEFYVFTKNPEKSEELCKEAFKKFPNYQWKSYIDEDREWDFYFDFLYPDVYSYHAIMNRSVIENLTNQGDNLEKEREIDHWLYFSSEENINIATKKFEELGHKIVRVIWYKNNDRLETIREKTFDGGYALLYEEIIEYILTIIPQEEIIKDSIRENILSFPEIAIRELVANTLIHQSLEQKGTNPMIEVFSNRIEFSNAGSPLVSINRIIDTVPLSRNENLAGFMHKCGICEERGSGYDKVIFSTSSNSMIAPKIENQDNSFTKVILYSKIPFDLTKKEDRIRTCYMKACLSYVNGQAINNSDIRELFGLSLNDKYKSSRIIKDTLEKRLIKPVDELTAPRYMKYIPFWA